MSGEPGRSLACSRYLAPICRRRRLTRRSGPVSTLRMLRIICERTAGAIEERDRASLTARRMPSTFLGEVISISLRFIEIDEAGLRQGLAHIVHVEPERARGELLALGFLVG